MTESTGHPAPSLERAVALVTGALASAARAGLLTDFDGTLSPIAADPALARPASGASELLSTLARRLTVVAIVTGRAASDARWLIGTPDVLVVGNHGLEWLDPGADAPRSENGVRDVPEEILERVPAGAGVIVERKGPSASIHYRLTPDREAARERILGSLRGALPAGLAVSEGRMSVEIRPRGLGDKGSAAEAIVERHGLDAVVVMGDDVTDLDMFRAVARLRSAGRVRGVIVAVGSADGEVPDAVAAEADVMLAGPDEVVALLRAIS